MLLIDRKLVANKRLRRRFRR